MTPLSPFTLARLARLSRVAVALAWLGGASVALAQPFEERGLATGLTLDSVPVTLNSLSAAVSVGDLDGDGQDDVVVSGGNRAPAFFLRDGDGYERSPLGQVITQSANYSTGHVLFDMDGDGDLDIFVVQNGFDALLENDGQAGFVDVTATHLPGMSAWTQSATAVDFDGDGDLDLSVANYIESIHFPRHDCARNVLLENDGAGHFTPITDAVGLTETTGCSFVSVFTDHDDDGDLDFFVINDFANFTGFGAYYQNDGPQADGQWSFSDQSAAIGFHTPVYGMGLGLGDIGNDDRPDFVITNIGEAMLLTPDAQTGMLKDVSLQRGVAKNFGPVGFQVTWTSRIVDLDGDGYQDLLFAGSNLFAANFIRNSAEQRNMWLRGRGDGSFEEASTLLDPTFDQNLARDMALSDFDQDGRMDVFFAHIDGRASLLVNQGATPSQTRVRLRPRLTGAGAAGAKLTAKCGDELQRRRVHAGGLYGSHDDGWVWFAFANSACQTTGVPVTLTVRWPSGYSEQYDITTGTPWTLEEPAWLTVGAGIIEVDLTAGSPSSPPTAETSVVISGDDIDLGPLTPHPTLPGIWQGTYARPASAPPEGRLDVTVDGMVSGAHPRVRYATSEPVWLRTFPARPVVADFTTVHAAVLDANGDRVVDPGMLAVRTSETGVGTVLSHVGDGHFVGEIIFDSEGETSLQLVRNNVDYGDAIVRTVASPIDPERTSFNVQNLHIVQDVASLITLWVRFAPRDINGKRLFLMVDEVNMRSDGVTLTPSNIGQSSGWLSLRFDHTQLVDGQTLDLSVRGVRIGPPITVRQVATSLDLEGVVDPSTSSCLFSERRLLADGQDIATAQLFVSDSHGSGVDLQAVPTIVADNLTVLPNFSEASGGGFRLRVQAGTEVRDGVLEIYLDGASDPIRCVIPVIAPPAHRPVSPADSLIARTGLLPSFLAGDGFETLQIIPRDDQSRALGSGLDLSLIVSGGTIGQQPVYIGWGEYSAAYKPPETGGSVDIAVEDLASGVRFSATFEVAGGVADEEPDTTGDATVGDTIDEDTVTADVLTDASDLDTDDDTELDDVSEDTTDHDTVADTTTAPDASDVTDTDEVDTRTETDAADSAAGDTSQASDTTAGEDSQPTSDTTPMEDTQSPVDTTLADDTGREDAAPMDTGPENRVRANGCVGGGTTFPAWILLGLALLAPTRRRRGILSRG